MAQPIDFSLYLVTGRNFVPSSLTYLESLEQALQGGVTVVQIREKEVDTAEFLQIASESKSLCDRYGVPLFINDRVDIALAVGAHVHLGQSDMPIPIARRLLPEGTIIGQSCGTVEEVEQAVKHNVDYVGIGSVWPTKTKDLPRPAMGVRSIGAMLKVLDGTQVKAVAIGGIKTANLLRTLHGCASDTHHSLDGVAVVTEIMASQNPRKQAEGLITTIRAFKSGERPVMSLSSGLTADTLLQSVGNLVTSIRTQSPLIHQITNNVVATQSANITLSLGASPIMATAPEEMEDLAKICNALLVNIGTLTTSTFEGMSQAGTFANANRKPVVFDPVGVGATSFRKERVRELLNMWQTSVIKGNAGEIAALVGSTEVASKGVDSVGTVKDPHTLVKTLALRERCVVAMTGATDYITDGSVIVEVSNGNELLSQITGSGCIVGSAVASYAAVVASQQGPLSEGKLIHDNMLLAAVAGILAISIAAELAVECSTVTGPGTFLPALIDEVRNLKADDILRHAKVKLVAA